MMWISIRNISLLFIILIYLRRKYYQDEYILDIFQNIVLIDGINMTSEIEKIVYFPLGKYYIKF
jgi:hypothetical protein